MNRSLEEWMRMANVSEDAIHNFSPNGHRDGEKEKRRTVGDESECRRNRDDRLIGYALADVEDLFPDQNAELHTLVGGEPVPPEEKRQASKQGDDAQEFERRRLCQTTMEVKSGSATRKRSGCLALAREPCGGLQGTASFATGNLVG